MKRLLWKFSYTRYMQRVANCSFSFAWESANASLELFDMDCSPQEAADEEMSCWEGEGL